MSAFRNSVLGLLISAGFCGAVLAQDPAAEPVQGPAQGPATAPPRGIMPSVSDDPDVPGEPGGPQTAPNVNEDTGPTLLAPKAGQPAGAFIEVQGLREPDPAGLGFFDASQGGLGNNMWASLSHETLRSRLPRLPDQDRSPAMRSLMRRLLLSANAGPAGSEDKNRQPTILSLRGQKLISAGLSKDAVSLASRAPKADAESRQAYAEALLLEARETDACALLQTAPVAGASPFWPKLRIYCQIAANDIEAARLALDVLRESGANDDVFVQAAQTALEGAASAPAPILTSAIQAAMWRKSAAPAAPQILDANWVPGFRILSATTQDAVLKLSAVGLESRGGSLTPGDWLPLAMGHQFKPDQLDDPDEAALKLPVSAGDALFLQAMKLRKVPAARASALAAVLSRAEARGEFPFAAHILKDAALALDPGPETAWATPLVARVLIYHKKVARAEEWFKALSAGSPSDQPVINAIQIYGWLAQPSPERAQKLQGALTWLNETATGQGQNKRNAHARIVREFPVLAALGVTVPVNAQWALTAGSSGLALSQEDSELLDDMENAAQMGAKGEVALNAAIVLKGKGLGVAQAQTAARIIRAMMRAGLKSEAKALAMEAILGGPAG